MKLAVTVLCVVLVAFAPTEARPHERDLQDFYDNLGEFFKAQIQKAQDAFMGLLSKFNEAFKFQDLVQQLVGLIHSDGTVQFCASTCGDLLKTQDSDPEEVAKLCVPLCNAALLKLENDNQQSKRALEDRSKVNDWLDNIKEFFQKQILKAQVAFNGLVQKFKQTFKFDEVLAQLVDLIHSDTTVQFCSTTCVSLLSRKDSNIDEDNQLCVPLCDAALAKIEGKAAMDKLRKRSLDDKSSFTDFWKSIAKFFKKKWDSAKDAFSKWGSNLDFGPTVDLLVSTLKNTLGGLIHSEPTMQMCTDTCIGARQLIFGKSDGPSLTEAAEDAMCTPLCQGALVKIEESIVDPTGSPPTL